MIWSRKRVHAPQAPEGVKPTAPKKPMKTKRDWTGFGIFIPKGTPVEDTESCAVLARYDEARGCTFTKGEKGTPGYMHPRPGTPIALPREIADL